MQLTVRVILVGLISTVCLGEVQAQTFPVGTISGPLTPPQPRTVVVGTPVGHVPVTINPTRYCMADNQLYTVGWEKEGMRCSYVQTTGTIAIGGNTAVGWVRQ